ncbi:hypothetical protein KJ657_04065 [Patescibacteria group bacterium]|nr:hypothetical protein [Patescibacteria group bacterium]MBU1016240.1 hypothetical protein [Patescibacteria group bacterium]
MTKINTKKAGFSLIELLFAMLFLSVIVFGVIKLQTSNLTLSNTKQLELKAYSYASQGLEIVDALGKAAVTVCTTPCYLKKNSNYSIENDGTESLENGLFQRSFERNEMNLSGGATMVTMTVAWTDSSGEHSASAKRIIFK